MKTILPPPHPAAAHSRSAFPLRQPVVQTQELSSTGWMPRPWSDQILGLIFLPRMLEKGRRVLAGSRQGRNLMNDYLFGRFDYADGSMLKFLRTTDARVLELLGGPADDAAVAQTLLRESGRTAAEIQAWNKRFRTLNVLFTAMWDADEGRRTRGFGTSLLKFSYNYGLMPPVYVIFRIAQKLSASPHRNFN